MKNLEDLIKGFEISDVRIAFYYLSRYLKQADYFEEYQKDFFEDYYLSVPSDTAKNLTFSFINFIEEKSAKKASKFNDKEYIQWMDEINSIESQLDPEPSTDVKNSADKVIDELFFSEIGKNNK